MDVTYEPKKQNIIPFFQSGDYFFHRGVIAYRKNHLQRAVKLLERAVKLTEQEPVFHIQLAAVLAEMGQYERSNEILEAVLEELDKEQSECYFFMANNYAYLGLFEKAERAAQTYLSLCPDGDFANDTNDLLELLTFEKEEEDEEWELSEPESDQYLLQHEKARHLLKEGFVEDAIPVLQAIIEEHPTCWAAHNRLAEALFRLGDESAFDVCESILENDRGNLFALCNLAVFFTKMDRFAEARPFIEAIRSVHPLDLEHRLKLAQVLCTVGEYEEAYERLRDLEKTSIGQNRERLTCFGVSAYHLDKEAKALQNWKKAAKLGSRRAADLYALSMVDVLRKHEVTYDLWEDEADY
ncbi:tetratricopeptide repeat protein [Halalkalibacterium ligniniphilum]|uniref:tetratricopeptide repeat protein n=1 Tax=Halalkalibacterium ligniniphilum TaxID=1134413 RepID=UPI00034B7B09|nr:tetratricopeptide repeat protein [Halalkalibacterium ligniniphilum]